MKATLNGKNLTIKRCPDCRGLLRYDRQTHLRIYCGTCAGNGSIVSVRAEVSRAMSENKEYPQRYVDALNAEIARLKSVLANLMPFVLEDYYPDCATSEYKAAVEAAKNAVSER